MPNTKQGSPLLRALRNVLSDCDACDNVLSQDKVTLVEQRMIAASTTIRTKPEWESQVDDSKVHEIWSAEIKEKHGVKDVEIEYILAELKYYAKLNAAGQKHGTSATVVDMVWTTEIPADDELARDVRNQVAAVLEDDLLLKTPDWSSPDNVSDSATIPEFNDKLRVAGKPRYTKRTLIDPSLYPFVDGATSTSKSPIALPFDERKHIYMGWGPGITKYMRRKFMDYVQDHYDDLDLSFECDDVKRALVKAKLEYEARYNPKRRAGKESLAASDAPLISDNAMDPGLNASNINLQDIADRYLDDIYHWLPSDTLVAADGTVEIKSYINNLHPVKYASMYKVIERAISRCLPVLSQTLTDLVHRPYFRVSAEFGECIKIPADPPNHPRLGMFDFRKLMASKEEVNRWLNSIILTEPEPGNFIEPKRPLDPYTLGGEKLQVYVQMDSIHVSPDEPQYPGGYFKADGGSEDEIIAAAVYYYDVENIDNLQMVFNECINVQEQSDLTMSYLDQILYGINVTQDFSYHESQLGPVSIKNGTIICYPNVYEHKLSEIKLADTTKTGHVKMLTFYFADPTQTVISTAVVPPQQRMWQDLTKQINEISNNRLPRDVVNKIASFVDSSWAPGMAAFVSNLVEQGIDKHNNVRTECRTSHASDMNYKTRMNGCTGDECPV